MEKEINDLINQAFIRAQIDALKATLTEDDKKIYNDALIFQRNALLKRLPSLSPSKVSEIAHLFEKALV